MNFLVPSLPSFPPLLFMDTTSSKPRSPTSITRPTRSFLPSPFSNPLQLPQLTGHVRIDQDPPAQPTTMPIASNRCMQCDHIRIRRQIEISTGRRPRCHQISGVLYDSLLNWSRYVPHHLSILPPSPLLLSPLSPSPPGPSFPYYLPSFVPF